MHKFLLFLVMSIFFFIVGCGSESSNVHYPTYNTSINNDTEECQNPNTITAVNPRPMLVILVNYNNVSFQSNSSTWRKKIFGKSDHQLNDYYLEVSSNQFEFQQAMEDSGCANDGIISINIDKNHPDIDINNPAFAQNVYNDLKNALIATDNNVDFSNYDNDANGKITSNELLLTFIIAGFEDAYESTHVTNGIWAHQYCMTESANSPTLDGVSLMGCQNGGNFALFGEKHDIAHPDDATIGIIAHELGHATFNLPDLYNTQNVNSGGIGNFGLMGGGTWAQQNAIEYPGNTPVHFSAWSKIYNGWLNASTSTGNVILHASSSIDYNVVKIPINATSYYLLENRGNNGYDKGLYSLTGNFNGGMALWKVDETKLTAQHFDDNNVNADTQNKGVDLVEAQVGNIDSHGGGGDEDALYYEGNKNSFSTLITNISQRGSSMSLNIN